jgi:polyribonucleotide nucleotidyltransferase
VTEELMAHYIKADSTEVYKIDVKRAYHELRSQIMRAYVLETGIRLDGRQTTQIRPIEIETGILPRTHGSCLFTRGETQSVAVCTLGSDSMGQRYEDLNEDSTRRFYLQYTFPPFSVGEVGRMGAPGRREVGHGKLAERALLPLVPPKEQFTYTLRLESNITESNGSSSMASVCGGCLAMMDAGVPIKRPVAGIAMGLILEKDRFAILSDILGAEDALGDMDFKVAGDREGITAFQMDIKVEGITLDIMEAALIQAKAGRIHILEEMLKACPSSKASLSQYAPRIVSLKIKPSQIGTVIGPGGKQIRNIIETCGPNVTVDIDDTGLVAICGTNAKGVEAAEKMVRHLTAEAEVGKTYEGKVTEVLAFGVIVEIFPGKEGLCHVSEMDSQRVQNPSDIAKVGDNFVVKVLEMDERGKVRLSRKATLPRPVKAAE